MDKDAPPPETGRPATATLVEDVLIGAESLETFLSVWATRDDTQAQPKVRQAASDAVRTIDGLLRDLHTIRERLLVEIRHSDDVAAARVDTLLARCREAGLTSSEQYALADRLTRDADKAEGHWGEVA